jgi:hypothetical protein
MGKKTTRKAGKGNGESTAWEREKMRFLPFYNIVIVAYTKATLLLVLVSYASSAG